MGNTIHVEGLRELQSALRRAASDVGHDLRDWLKEAGEPARDAAERQAVSRIRNIGPKWSRMRLGVTTRAVYIAPKARRSGGSPRGNMGPLLLDAMEAAVDERRSEVEAGIEDALDRFIDTHGL